MKKGVLYHFSGGSYTACLICSLQQLRKFYAGAITIAATPDCRVIAETISSDPNIWAYVQPIEGLPSRKHHWMSKANSFANTPYDRTLFLDADTIMLRDCVQDFFTGGPVQLPILNGAGLGEDNRWGRYFRERMDFWHELGPCLKREYMECIAANPPIINTGVMAFDRNDPLVTRMLDLMLASRTCRTASDETAAQLLLPTMSHELLPGRYNWISRRSVDREKWIRHFTRRNWKLREAREYAPYIAEAIETNAGTMGDWMRNCFGSQEVEQLCQMHRQEKNAAQ